MSDFLYYNSSVRKMESAALILGIISVVTCLILYISIPCGALAIMFAFLSRGGNYKMSEKGIHIHKFQDGNEAVVVEFGIGKIGIGLDKNCALNLAVHLQELKERFQVLYGDLRTDICQSILLKHAM